MYYRESSNVSVHIVAVILGTLMVLWGMSNTPQQAPTAGVCYEPCKATCLCPDPDPDSGK